MAPRFKQLLFQMYECAQGADAFIGFPVDQFEQIPAFADALRMEFARISGFAYRMDIVGPYNIDVRIRFFDSEGADAVNAFYSKPWPGCFSLLLHTRHYRDYKAEENNVKKLITIEISTSHDYPCVVISSATLTTDSIAQLIEKVAHDLELSIVRSRFPRSLVSILTSNGLYDAKERHA